LHKKILRKVSGIPLSLDLVLDLDVYKKLVKGGSAVIPFWRTWITFGIYLQVFGEQLMPQIE